MTIREALARWVRALPTTVDVPERQEEIIWPHADDPDQQYEKLRDRRRDV